MRAEYPGKHNKKESSAMFVDGKREWITYETLAVDGEDFEQIGAAFEQEKTVYTVPLGSTTIKSMKQRELVDFAVRWMEANR